VTALPYIHIYIYTPVYTPHKHTHTKCR